VIDRVRDHADVARAHAAPDELVARARRHRDGRNAAIEARHETLGDVRRRGDRERDLAEGRPPEEVVHEDDERLAHPEAGEERELVQVLDDDVERRRGAEAPVGARDERVVRELVSEPDDVDAVDVLLGRAARESRGEERHAVACGGEPPEDLEAVDLGAARLRVAEVALVHDEDATAHRRPSQ
jgi:hypothetical protein